MSRKWTIYLSIAAVAVVALLVLVRADKAAPKGETRLCVWNTVAIDARSARSLAGGPQGQTCVLSADGLTVSLDMFATTKAKTVINVKELKRRFHVATSASATPALDVSPAKILSWPYLLLGNRAPLSVYSAPDRRHGFVLVGITDRIVLAGFWTAAQPIKASRITDLVRIRINPAGDKAIWALGVKFTHSVMMLLAALPLLVIGFGASIYRSIDQWWNVRTPVGLLVYAGLIPALLFLLVWIAFAGTGWSTLSALMALLASVALFQIVTKLVADHGSLLPLAPFDAPNLTIFKTLRASSTELEIADTGIPMGHSLDVEMWFPRRVHCAKCDLQYAVYVPSQSSRSVGHAIRNPEEISEETRKQLYIEAVQAAPQLVNGCIRCGHPAAGAAATAIKRDDLFAINAKSVLGSFAAFAFAMALMFKGGVIVDFCEKIPWIGWLLGAIFDEGAKVVIFFLSVPMLYVIWRLLADLADRNAMNSPGLHRMSACPKEGLVFEDMEAERDPTCPSCSGQLEPMRRFRVGDGQRGVAASPA